MALVDTVVAFTALAVAVVALFVSCAQLLQQYFATAEGYRNCKYSVMGQWALKTHRKLRLSECRFEVFFETPEIFLTGPDVPDRDGQIRIIGTTESRKETLVPLEAFDPGLANARPDNESMTVQKHLPLTGPIANTANELVCWLPLLHWIHETTGASLDLSELTNSKKLEQAQFENATQSVPLVMKTLPALVSRKRSWDFQPPDVVRPMATTAVSDIVILGRRMGMRWKDLRPEDGVMHAEGHCHILSSTVSRSLGIVLHYSFSGRARSLRRSSISNQTQASTLRPDPDEVYIPSTVADKLGFGLIGGDSLGLEIPPLRAGSQWDIASALDAIDPSGDSGAKLRTHLHENPGFTFRMGDIIALTTPMAHQLGSSLVQVPSPSDNVHGFTTSIYGRQKFRSALREYMNEHPVEQTNEYQEEKDRLTRQANEGDSLISIWPKPKGMQLDLICKEYDKFKRFPQWEDSHEAWAVRRDKAYLDAVHRCYDDLGKYLRCDSRYRYVDLVAHHIRRCVFRPSSRRLQGYSAEDEVSHWFREMQKIAEHMEHTGKITKEEVDEAWIVMMFRACCWGACHFFVPGERAPSTCYGSQLPVYIG